MRVPEWVVTALLHLLLPVGPCCDTCCSGLLVPCLPVTHACCLLQLDRTKTPWVIVAIHAPWYHTYAGHYKEVECMRQRYESLFAQYQVDLVLSGHVHAYERIRPVINYQVRFGIAQALLVLKGEVAGWLLVYTQLVSDCGCFYAEMHAFRSAEESQMANGKMAQLADCCMLWCVCILMLCSLTTAHRCMLLSVMLATMRGCTRT